MVDYDLASVNLQQTRLESPYLNMIGLTFFTPTLEGFNDAMRAFYPVRMETPGALLVPWEGYKRFGFYCKEANPLPDRYPCL